MKRLHTLVCFLCFESFSFHLEISLVGEIVVNYPFGKTLNSIDLVNLMSSISVRFNSFLFSYSIFNERKDLILSDLIFFCHRGLKFQLIAVNRVLHRLLMPRHSPYALVRLNFLLLFSLRIV